MMQLCSVEEGMMQSRFLAKRGCLSTDHLSPEPIMVQHRYDGTIGAKFSTKLLRMQYHKQKST